MFKNFNFAKISTRLAVAAVPFAFVYCSNNKLTSKQILYLTTEHHHNQDLSNTEKDFIKRMTIPVQVYLDIKNRLHKESKNCLKNIIQSKHQCSKDDAEEIASFVIKIRKSN